MDSAGFPDANASGGNLRTGCPSGSYPLIPLDPAIFPPGFSSSIPSFRQWVPPPSVGGLRWGTQFITDHIPLQQLQALPERLRSRHRLTLGRITSRPPSGQGPPRSGGSGCLEDRVNRADAVAGRGPATPGIPTGAHGATPDRPAVRGPGASRPLPSVAPGRSGHSARSVSPSPPNGPAVLQAPSAGRRALDLTPRT